MAVGAVLENLAHAWHWIALRGLFALLFGIFAFIWPGITLAALVLVWGAYAIADGVMALIAAYTMHEEGKPMGSLIIVGILGIAAGVVTFLWPGNDGVGPADVHSVLGGAHGNLRDRCGYPFAQTHRERMAACAFRRGVDRFRRADVSPTRSRGPRGGLVDRQLRHFLRHLADCPGVPAQGACKPNGDRGNARGSTQVINSGDSIGR